MTLKIVGIIHLMISHHSGLSKSAAYVCTRCTRPFYEFCVSFSSMIRCQSVYINLSSAQNR